MHRVDRAARGVGGYGGPERRIGDAEAHLLALHVAARLRSSGRLISAGQQRVAARLSPVCGDHPGQEENRHRRPDGPAVLRRPGHAPERVGQAGRDGEDRDHLQQVRKRRGVLKWVGAVGVEEPAPVGPQFLDELLGGHRPLGNRLLGDVHGLLHRLTARVLDDIALRVLLIDLRRLRVDDLRRVIGTEVLHHPLRDEKERADNAEGQQHPEGGAYEVHPEVADGLRLAPRDAADEGDGDGNARGRRGEVVVSQAGHLRKVTHRRLGHVRLPVGVGRKTGRRVKSRAEEAGAGT